MRNKRTLAIILAGGKGSRLDPLTQDRAKPAVPFAGGYRIIDFPMSNCINSGMFQVLVLTQYKSLSLDRHLDMAWKPLFQRDLGAYLEVIPPQQRIDNDWYLGTAHAVYQNIYSIEQMPPDNVLILAGDHAYSMDYREMLHFHLEHDADVTVGAYRVPVEEAAHQFGVIQTDRHQRVIGFEEKPARPTPIPGDPAHALASMGIYVFKTRFLFDSLLDNAAKPDGGHDFGHHILPAVYADSNVFSYTLRAPGGGAAYWKDVGTLDAYYEATQDLLRVDSPLRMDDEDWPIRTFKPNLPPPIFLLGGDAANDGSLRDSIVCSGSKIVGAAMSKSVLGYKCHISPGSRLDGSILLGNVTVGRDVQLRRTIVDKDSMIPDGSRIGFDRAADEARGFTVSPGGITVVPRGNQ
jgi:glucose-1-phosphate adenylyltransferase